MTSNPPTNATRSWNAKLDLRFAYKNCKTLLKYKQHSGPLMVQKPFYPEQNGCCHVYIIHPPGGIVGGDSLTINASLEANAHTLITTPAATKFYKSNSFSAIQNQTINIAEHATAEWLPQETIYFNGTQAYTKTRINIVDNCKFIAWEIQCLGQPSNQEVLSTGACVQKLEIWKNSRPLLLECNRIKGGDKILSSPWGLNNFAAIGSLVFSRCEKTEIVKLLKDSVKTTDEVVIGYTTLNNIVVVRVMAQFAEQIKELFSIIWQIIRPAVVNQTACSPRIWQT